MKLYTINFYEGQQEHISVRNSYIYDTLFDSNSENKNCTLNNKKCQTGWFWINKCASKFTD